MTLAEYIRKIGPSVFAHKFGVTERTAFSYIYGTRKPRPALAERIVKETPVSWAGVYADSAREH